MVWFYVGHDNKKADLAHKLVWLYLKTFVQPSSIDSNIEINFPITFKNAKPMLHSGAHSIYRDFPVNMFISFTSMCAFHLRKNGSCHGTWN